MVNGRRFLTRAFFISILCISLFTARGTVSLAQEDLISGTKQGIVEIYSGFYSGDGVFHRLQHASGFIISNGEDKAYIITVYNALKNTEKSKKAYCKKHEISYENSTLDDSVQVVVKGDVTVQASVMTESEKENFSILQLEGRISERSAVVFGSDEDVRIGDTVYALGFAEDAGDNDDATDRHTEFAAMDVKVDVGTVQDTGANKDGILYLQHSAQITGGNTGGALLNEEGYVVGLNNAVLNEEGTMVYYSLPIGTIRGILDNFGIAYQNVEQLERIESYRQLLEESERLLNDTTYKQASKEALQTAVNEGKSIILDERTSAEELDAVSEKLQEAHDLLRPKMKNTRKAVIALGVVILLLGIWLAVLLAWKWKAGREGNQSEEKKARRDKRAGTGTEAFGNDFADSAENEKTENRQTERQENLQEQREKVDTGQDFRQEARSNNISFSDMGEGTVLLGSSMDFRKQSDSFYDRRLRATIKDIKTGKVLMLEKPEIYIGKKEEMNDFVVRNNSNVSRRHACISWEQGNYYIQDLQSSNGTFVNGTKIEFGNRHRLQDKDRFVLANEEFIFREITD